MMITRTHSPQPVQPTLFFAAVAVGGAPGLAEDPFFSRLSSLAASERLEGGFAALAGPGTFGPVDLHRNSNLPLPQGGQVAVDGQGNLSAGLDGCCPFGLRVENGRVFLPNGQSVPFNNRGVIVELPDGTQIAVGRQGDDAQGHNRWTVAGPGQKIETSPPGKTDVIRLSDAGSVASRHTV